MTNFCLLSKVKKAIIPTKEDNTISTTFVCTSVSLHSVSSHVCSLSFFVSSLPSEMHQVHKHHFIRKISGPQNTNMQREISKVHHFLTNKIKLLQEVVLKLFDLSNRHFRICYLLFNLICLLSIGEVTGFIA